MTIIYYKITHAPIMTLTYYNNIIFTTYKFNIV